MRVRVAVAHLDHRMRAAREGRQEPAIGAAEMEALHHGVDRHDVRDGDRELGRARAHRNISTVSGTCALVLGVDAHALEGGDAARIMVAHEEQQPAMRTGHRLRRDVLGDALAMHALHAPRQRAAMLGLDRGVVDAGVECCLHRLADQPLGAGEIDAQAHMGGGQRLLQARQGGRRSTDPRRTAPAAAPSARSTMFARRRAGHVDDVGAGEEVRPAPPSRDPGWPARPRRRPPADGACPAAATACRRRGG